MWIFTPFGFFSAVAHRDDTDLLLVRARAHADLAVLRARLGWEPGEMADVEHTPNADYPYRLMVPRRWFAAFVETFVLDDLTYDNFKSEVARVAGHARAEPLHDVWATMHKAEDEAARAGRRRVRRTS